MYQNRTYIELSDSVIGHNWDISSLASLNYCFILQSIPWTPQHYTIFPKTQILYQTSFPKSNLNVSPSTYSDCNHAHLFSSASEWNSCFPLPRISLRRIDNTWCWQRRLGKCRVDQVLIKHLSLILPQYISSSDLISLIFHQFQTPENAEHLTIVVWVKTVFVIVGTLSH